MVVAVPLASPGFVAGGGEGTLTKACGVDVVEFEGTLKYIRIITSFTSPNIGRGGVGGVRAAFRKSAAVEFVVKRGYSLTVYDIAGRDYSSSSRRYRLLR